MSDLLLIYPYFNDNHSIFKFPPLGLGYIASYLTEKGYSVELLDCTFMTEEEAIQKAKIKSSRVIGIYSMLSMKDSAIQLAKQLKGKCDLIITGGPLPTTRPEDYLHDFDVAVIGEGEETLLEILTSLDKGQDLSKVNGISFREAGLTIKTPPRKFVKNLDVLPFPSRNLFDHTSYKRYYQKYHGYTITSMITSRGCPFSCEFCSRPVFGNFYRSRSPKNIVDEIENIIPYGYDRLWIADDIFPMNKKIGIAVCDEIVERKMDVSWECLCRADAIDIELVMKMRKAGCYRLFFGLESGNNNILKIMKKQITVEKTQKAIETVKSAGIKAGAFFILGYPGENNDTMLDTIRFSSLLPLDYLSFTVPYPLPGTELYERIKDTIIVDEWRKPKHGPVKHILLYQSEFSLSKLKFGIMKAKSQYYLNKYFHSSYLLIGKVFELVTDYIFKLMR